MTQALRCLQSGVALAISAWLLGACGGVFTGNGSGCEYDGARYADGESFPAGNSCNTCTCNDGKVACTRSSCSTPLCVHEGVSYEVGARFNASDGCNTCSCEQDGVVSCTQISCDSCQEVEEDYRQAIDAAKTCDPQASDQCSQLITEGLVCTCGTFANSDNAAAIAAVREAQERYDLLGCSANVVCGACGEATSGYCTAEGRCETRFDAPGNSSAVGCMVGGIVYESGASDIDDPFSCNTCSCLNGELACTKLSCPEDCPPNSVAGTRCVQCGPADGCEVVEHACLLLCTDDDSCEEGACIDGTCRVSCG